MGFVWLVRGGQCVLVSSGIPSSLLPSLSDQVELVFRSSHRHPFFRVHSVDMCDSLRIDPFVVIIDLVIESSGAVVILTCFPAVLTEHYYEPHDNKALSLCCSQGAALCLGLFDLTHPFSICSPSAFESHPLVPPVCVRPSRLVRALSSFLPRGLPHTHGRTHPDRSSPFPSTRARYGPLR